MEKKKKNLLVKGGAENAHFKRAAELKSWAEQKTTELFFSIDKG